MKGSATLSLDALPTEVLGRIFAFLSFQDLLCCRHVCRSFLQAAAHVPEPWQLLDLTILDMKVTDKTVRQLAQLVTRERGRPRAVNLSFLPCITSVSILLLCAAFGPSLEEIQAEGCEGLDDVSMLAISGLPRLRVLHVGRCAGISSAALDALHKCRRLESLTLSHHFDLPDALVKSVLDACPLRSLTVRNCPLVTADAFAVLPPSLTKLELISCTRIDDIIASALACNNLSKLTHLSLHGCCSITDEAVVTVADAAAGLRSLDIGQCYIVSDAGLGGVARACPALRHVVLDFCPSITDAGIAEMLRRCSALEVVGLRDCPQVTVRAVGMLRAAGVAVRC